MKTLNGLRDKEQIYSSSHQSSQDTGKEKMPSLPLPAFPLMLPTPAASSHSLQILLTPTTSSAAPSRLFLPCGRARPKVAHRAGGCGMRRCWHSSSHHRPGDAREDCLHSRAMQPCVQKPWHEDGSRLCKAFLALKTSWSKIGLMLTVGLGETCKPSPSLPQ